MISVNMIMIIMMMHDYYYHYLSIHLFLSYIRINIFLSELQVIIDSKAYSIFQPILPFFGKLPNQ